MHDVAANSYTYAHCNRQGSVIAASNAAGQVTAQNIYTYSAYGEPNILAGFPYRYTGRRLDSETGLYYYRARYYNAEMGRFLQTDPIGYEDQMNLYAYVGNDPLRYTDPTGQTKLIVSGLKILRKTVQSKGDFGGALKSEVGDIAENILTLADGKIDLNDVMAVVDLATGVDAGDVNNGLKAAERLRDSFSGAVGKKAATVTAGFDKKTGNVAAGRSDGCGVNCAEDTVKEALGGDKADVAFTTAIRPRTGKEVPISKDCQNVHGEEAFPPDAKRQ